LLTDRLNTVCKSTENIGTATSRFRGYGSPAHRACKTVKLLKVVTWHQISSHHICGH